MTIVVKFGATSYFKIGSFFVAKSLNNTFFISFITSTTSNIYFI